ncbi:MAG: tRNA preQ1(34) S-adenosylmethionine ribosyltransferase-isomerase QueA [bacterium]
MKKKGLAGRTMEEDRIPLLSELDYELPKHLIAQKPSEKRDECRLLVYERENNIVSHCLFKDIVRFFKEDDILVLNDVKVIKARLLMRKDKTGANIEILLLRRLDGKRWVALTRPAKRLKIDTEMTHDSGLLKARVVALLEGGERLIELEHSGDLFDLLDKIGVIPLPPYIKRKSFENTLNDEHDYQTVFAKNLYAIASPTAGLHFTEGLLDEIRAKGVEIEIITLKVGYGTFSPIKTEDIRKHRIEQEEYYISRKTAIAINRGLAMGRRIVLCGTTVVRALEDSCYKYNKIKYGWNIADLFIYSGFNFKTTGALITNFHLPRSSLMALVSAYIGIDRLKEIYKVAIGEGYRFFSYGDAMLII